MIDVVFELIVVGGVDLVRICIAFDGREEVSPLFHLMACSI